MLRLESFMDWFIAFARWDLVLDCFSRLWIISGKPLYLNCSLTVFSRSELFCSAAFGKVFVSLETIIQTHFWLLSRGINYPWTNIESNRPTKRSSEFEGCGTSDNRVQKQCSFFSLGKCVLPSTFASRWKWLWLRCRTPLAPRRYQQPYPTEQP